MNNINNLSIISLEEINQNERKVSSEDEIIYNSLSNIQKIEYLRSIIKQTFTEDDMIYLR
ncbi:MAG: hypothetical protein ACOVNU_03190 [Candidatus Kapaibacteriota bacterium]